MAKYNNNGLSVAKTDRYGSHYTAWCKEKTTKDGKVYYEGYLWFAGNKGVKVVFYVDNVGTDNKGNTVHPIEVTVFKSQRQQSMGI